MARLQQSASRDTTQYIKMCARDQDEADGAVLISFNRINKSSRLSPANSSRDIFISRDSPPPSSV